MCPSELIENKRGYFYNSRLKTLIVGYIGGEGSIYCKFFAGKVVYSKPFCGGSRPWRIGYKYNNWDFSDFEYIPVYAFKKPGFMKFLENASNDQIRAYFEVKDLIGVDENGNLKL